MGRAKDLGSLYRLDEQATKDMLDRILEDEEDKELGNKFKLKELSNDSVLTICDRKMLEEYIINPMKSDFPIHLTNTTTLTSDMLRFCNNKVIIAYRTGRDYCELLKREVNLYRVKSCNTDPSFSNSGSSSVGIECYIFPDILFKEFWKNKEHEKIMRRKISSRYSKSLNLEKDFLNSLESAVKDKNSYIYQENKYSIYTEDDSFNEDIRMFMLYISPKTSDHYFVYSKRCQDRLFNILGIERDEYVTIDIKAMNRQLIKVKKNSCFPHILKNIKFTAHSILIDKNKISYIVICIQHVIHNMIYTSGKAIAIPFSMINSHNTEL